MILRFARRALLVLLPFCLGAQDLKEFEKKVTEFTLANGLHFIVLERHDAPVVSMFTMVDVGSANDVSGATGLAHMFEHMAFKGNDVLGTKNFAEEKKAMAVVEQAYDKLDEERRKGPRANAETVKKLEAELKAAIEKANSYSDAEAYSRTIKENGGVGLNAFTSTDMTAYFYSLPANRLELWAMLTSKQLSQPILREFYKERDVVREERRMRFESSAQGKAQELLMESAFLEHPYRSLIGFGSDVENLRASDAAVFFKKYYVPGNMVIAIAGDVTPKEVKRLADQYFSATPSGPLPPPVVTVEPKQEGERRIAVETPSQPFVFIGYKRPNGTDKDDPVFDVLNGVLSSGRTGMLYKDMVRDKKIALFAGASADFPGSKYPNLFLLYSLPAAGKTIEENEKDIYAILDKLKREKVDAATLARVKTKVRAGLIRQLDSSFGMAMQLATMYKQYGDWRKLFTGLDEIDRVTADDVQRVARQYFNDSARTVVYSKPMPSKGGDK
jgi:predicted Zn-dependent peptidase